MSDRVILIVESNPKDTPRLKVNNEKRDIRDALRNTDLLKQFTLEIEHAARFKDLSDAISRYRPEIIHFIGHGEGDAGLCFEGENGRKQLLSNDDIDGIFEFASRSVKFVYLNACYSAVQGKIIAKHIEHVVGMSDKVPDETALAFAEQFYHYIGLNESVADSFKVAQMVSKANGLTDHLIPVLLHKKDYANYDYSLNETPDFAGQPPKPEAFVPNSPLLLIPTSQKYNLMADKHYLETEAELDSQWGLLNARRVSTLTSLKLALGMDDPNIVYVYTKVENNQLMLDSDRHGESLTLDTLADWFEEKGVRPLLILVLHGHVDERFITEKIRSQSRFIWCVSTREERALERALNELSRITGTFFARSGQVNSVELNELVKALNPPSIVTSTCVAGGVPIELKVDAKSQRKAQQFRSALLRIMLGRDDLKFALGEGIRRHLGNTNVFVFAATGPKSACVFELPQQIHYHLLPKGSGAGVLVVNWPLHIEIDADSLASPDGWEVRSSIYDVISKNIGHGSSDLSELIAKKAKDRGIDANTGAILFHWNITVDVSMEEEQIKQWLGIWAEQIRENFGRLYSSQATLIHALCFQVKKEHAIDTFNQHVQEFVVRNIRKLPVFTAHSKRVPTLGNLEPDEIESFFNDEYNQQWYEYFRLKDFNIDAYDLSHWVCEQTGGEFEKVVNTLWSEQQSNYLDFIKDQKA